MIKNSYFNKNIRIEIEGLNTITFEDMKISLIKNNKFTDKAINTIKEIFSLFAKNGKLIVFCQESFYRYDNIRIVCERYGIPLINTNDILVIKNEISKHIT